MFRDEVQEKNSFDLSKGIHIKDFLCEQTKFTGISRYQHQYCFYCLRSSIYVYSSITSYVCTIKRSNHVFRVVGDTCSGYRLMIDQPSMIGCWWMSLNSKGFGRYIHCFI